MSILINSNLKYEFPYQVSLLFYEKFNKFFEQQINIEDEKYIGWELSLNITHSDKIKNITIKGPDIDKRNKIITYSIFNGNVNLGMNSKDITIVFMENMFKRLEEVFKDLKINVSNDLLTKFYERFIAELKCNYEKYIIEYTEDDQF